MAQNLAFFSIMQCSAPESSFFLRLWSAVGQNLVFFTIVQCSGPEYSIFAIVQCSRPVSVAPAELSSSFSPFRVTLGHHCCQIRSLRRSVKIKVSSLMWQHCWVVEAASVWIAQLRNLQECRCCPVWFAGLSVPSAHFVRFQVITAKLPSCRMWLHAVWRSGTNVSEEPAASNLYSSTQMVICLWSVNGHRRTHPLYCKSLGLTWSRRTAVVRPIITELHKLCSC